MNRRFKAFISYSWTDKVWADWAHRTIELYRTPRALVGAAGAHGTVPDRLRPIFKDREEEAAGHGITEAIEAALGQSEFLIVICSPRAAQSVWVNREIAWFKRNRDKTRILAVIVDGEPLASLTGDAAAECFPKSLLCKVDENLRPTDAAEDPPLAADARKSGDGKRRAKLKLIAAMLGLGLDDLVRRDERRRTIRRRIVTGAALALSGVMSALASFAVIARDEARIERAEAVAARSDAEDLVEFMLTDLHDNLSKVGRLDILKSPADKVLDYYRKQNVSKLEPDSLGRRARALHTIGEVNQLSGDAAGAHSAFGDAAKTTGELLRRDPMNWLRVFDHAQSVFWLAYEETERGDNAAAMKHFIEYRGLAERLVEIAPEKPDSQMELAYAEINVGTGLVKENRMAPAIDAFKGAQSALENVSPRTRDVALNLAQAYSHAASTRYKMGNLRDSIAEREKQLAVLDAPPLDTAKDSEAEEARAIALGLLVETYVAANDFDLAGMANARALNIWMKLRSVDPENLFWREQNAQALLASVPLHVRADTGGRAVQAFTTAFGDIFDAVSQENAGAYAKRALALCVSYAALLEDEGVAVPLINKAQDMLLSGPINEIERNGGDTKDISIYGGALIALGDAIRESQPSQARDLWERAANLLLSAHSNDAWILAHGLRTDIRTGQVRFQAIAMSSNFDLKTGLGGLFADDLQLTPQQRKQGENNVHSSLDHD